MTHIDELKTAIEIIKSECLQHRSCADCPLYFVMCIYTTPDAWQPTELNYEAEGEKIGVENDEC